MTTSAKTPFLVAAAQVAPVFLDRAATVDKACELIRVAGESGARLIVFPEGFIPTYPFWSWFIPAGKTQALRELYTGLLDNAITVGDTSTVRLCEAAKEADIAVVIGCCTAMHRDQIPDELSFKKEYLPDSMEWVNPGGSAIVDPDGKWVVEPVFEREEILYAEIDPAKMRGPRFQLDVAGHYSRPDIFQLAVNRRRQPMIQEAEELDPRFTEKNE